MWNIVKSVHIVGEIIRREEVEITIKVIRRVKTSRRIVIIVTRMKQNYLYFLFLKLKKNRKKTISFYCTCNFKKIIISIIFPNYPIVL